MEILLSNLFVVIVLYLGIKEHGNLAFVFFVSFAVLSVFIFGGEEALDTGIVSITYYTFYYVILQIWSTLVCFIFQAHGVGLNRILELDKIRFEEIRKERKLLKKQGFHNLGKYLNNTLMSDKKIRKTIDEKLWYAKLSLGSEYVVFYQKKIDEKQTQVVEQEVSELTKKRDEWVSLVNDMEVKIATLTNQGSVREKYKMVFGDETKIKEYQAEVDFWEKVREELQDLDDKLEELFASELFILNRMKEVKRDRMSEWRRHLKNNAVSVSIVVLMMSYLVVPFFALCLALFLGFYLAKFVHGVFCLGYKVWGFLLFISPFFIFDGFNPVIPPLVGGSNVGFDESYAIFNDSGGSGFHTILWAAWGFGLYKFFNSDIFGDILVGSLETMERAKLPFGSWISNVFSWFGTALLGWKVIK